ncbi:MAG: acyl-ACP desaturase [Chloroflexota bacterium]|nr:acyl-ACP desaturase [Chloroflexota bacterium]
MPGPWTREARERAAAREAHEAFIRYFRKAMKVRNWTPWDDLPLDEMGELGNQLSDDTVTIIQAYLGVEDYVGDYVEEGLNLLHNQRERRNLQLAWGMEELKHAEAWSLVLLHSGRRTQEQLDDYRDQVLAHKWSMRDNHPGLDTPLGVVCYAMVQERATYFNYDEMRKRIRQEYGLPERPTELERQRGKQIGAAGAFKIVANDEIAHHGIFLDLVRIYMKYLPHDTLDALLRVFNGFTMPALYLIPNASDLATAMERTLLHTPLKQGRFVNNPILDSLGFKNKRALERAVQQSKLLPPGLGPEHVSFSRTGEFVVSMQPGPADDPLVAAAPVELSPDK